MLSIIIPVGPGRDARTALQSLHDAGLGEADEILVVCDGHKLGALSAIGGKVPKMLETGTARGANVARNMGVNAASNPILCFLDDDDAYTPDTLNRIATEARTLPDISCWSLGWAFRSGRTSHSGRRPAILRESHICKRNRAGGCSSMVVRKTTFQAAGGFDEQMPSMQDWDLWLRLVRLTPIKTIAGPHVLYNDLPGNRISTNLAARVSGFERLLSKNAAHWPPGVIALHEARLAYWRYRAGQGNRLNILRPRAPMASIYYGLKSLLKS